MTKKDLSDEFEFEVFQNSLISQGKYYKANRNKNTTFLISAGAAGEVGYSKNDFWAADDCLYFDSEKINQRYLYYVLKTKQQFL